MNILVASSEVIPFSKTGGLADVCGTLPIEIKRLGHQVAVITPLYPCVRNAGLPLEPTDIEFVVPIGSKSVPGRLWKAELPQSDVPVYLVEQADYFERDGLYGDANGDYRDNCERFIFFSRAVLEAIPRLGMDVDLVHCNDWQTGLIPAYLGRVYQGEPYDRVGSLMTVHNLAYQGHFWHWDMLLTGLDWKFFNWRQMEFHGHVNLLKTGIVFANRLNTVSPRYALEIQSAPLGCGLESVLRHRADQLSGIINGVDYGIWNPATDPHLPTNYDSTSWKRGKTACKLALQEQLGLPVRDEVPLVGLIGRLASQKGWDLVVEVMRSWIAEQDVQWVVLGTGEEPIEAALKQLALACPRKVSIQLAFSEPMAHRIEAASDIFVMASQYEPCGLNQLYSLKYGAVPVVADTGGLANTILDARLDDVPEADANGFRFPEHSVESLDLALHRALREYRDHPADWDRRVVTGMNQDWSWRRSAREYELLYEATINDHRGGLH